MVLFTLPIGYWSTRLIYYAAKSNFNRDYMDKTMKEIFKKTRVSDFMTDETLVLSYEYNS